MNLNILVLPGDGIGTEVTREAVRVLRRVAAKWHHELKLTEGLLGGIAIHKTGSPLPPETARAGRPGRRHPDGRGGPAGVRQRAAGTAAGKRATGDAPGAGRLRQPAPGARVRVAARFFAFEESPGGRHRYDHRPRTDGRDLLRHSARNYGRRRGHAGGQYHDLHARGNRARCPHGLPPGARRGARRSPRWTSPTCSKTRSSGGGW